ncbi:MAG: hypothetical protein IPN80_13315 [Flavobacterium sp.]|nr:hypothetical protein [Flavobacterium sp.]
MKIKPSYGKLLPNLCGSAGDKTLGVANIDPNSNLLINTDIKNYVGYINATYNLFAGFNVLNTIRYNKQETENFREQHQSDREFNYD